MSSCAVLGPRHTASSGAGGLEGLLCAPLPALWSCGAAAPPCRPSSAESGPWPPPGRFCGSQGGRPVPDLPARPQCRLEDFPGEESRGPAATGRRGWRGPRTWLLPAVPSLRGRCSRPVTAAPSRGSGCEAGARGKAAGTRPSLSTRAIPTTEPSLGLGGGAALVLLPG